MKLLGIVVSIMALTPLMSAATATPPSFADSISWMRLHKKTGDSFESVGVMSDGGSRIVVRRPHAKPRRPNPGWQTGIDGPNTVYIKNYPFSRSDAKKTHADAIVAGVQRLRAFAPQHADDDVIVVTLRINGKTTSIEIPEFYGEGKDDNNLGSENHQRFLAVEKLLGTFDIDAFDSESK